jgi:hypothetical protein
MKMRRAALLLVALFFLNNQAAAQNPTCPTRPTGESSNACASTQFVQQNKGVSVLSAPGVDPTGATDSTAGLNTAMTTAGTGGLLYWPKGTYKVSSSLSQPIGQQWLCESAKGVSIQWGGANSGEVVTLNNALNNAIYNCTIDVLTATGMTGIHLLDAQFVKLYGVNVQSTGTVSPSVGSIGLRLQAGANGTGMSHNTAFNDIQAFRTSFFAVGRQYDGISTGPTVVTLNSSRNIDLENCSPCNRHVAWSDSNYDYDLSVFVNSANAIGTIYNDSGTPGSDVGVYANNIVNYGVQAFGGASSVSGVLFNVTKQIRIYQAQLSPDPAFPGVLFTDNMSRAVSYYIEQSNNGDGTNTLQISQKGSNYNGINVTGNVSTTGSVTSNNASQTIFGNTAAGGVLSLVGNNTEGHRIDASGNNLLLTTTLGSGGKGPLYSPTAPTISAGFCTSPTIPSNNGTAAFTINVGTACVGSTGTLTMPTSTTAWVCQFHDVTTPASNTVEQTGGSSTSVTLTNYSRTTRVAAAFTSSDVIRAACTAY